MWQEDGHYRQAVASYRVAQHQFETLLAAKDSHKRKHRSSRPQSAKTHRQQQGTDTSDDMPFDRLQEMISSVKMNLASTLLTQGSMILDRPPAQCDDATVPSPYATLGMPTALADTGVDSSGPGRRVAASAVNRSEEFEQGGPLNRAEEVLQESYNTLQSLPAQYRNQDCIQKSVDCCTMLAQHLLKLNRSLLDHIIF